MHWGCWSTGRMERRGALEPICCLEHGFWPSESCWEFRVGIWPRLMLLQSFHLAAMNLHLLLLHPGHFKQTGVSAAVCQLAINPKRPNRLQNGRNGPEQGLIDALQSRLHTPPMPAGLPSIAAVWSNLPQEWAPSTPQWQLRHIGVLLRVTLCR